LVGEQTQSFAGLLHTFESINELHEP